MPDSRRRPPTSPCSSAPSTSPVSGGSRGEADVALILEGTYPYAVGGVSTWTDGLIRRVPSVRFGIVHLHAGPPPVTAAFSLPRNVAWHVDLALPDDLDRIDADAIARSVPPHRLAHALSTGFAGLVGAALVQQRDVPFLLTEHGIYWNEIDRGSPELETGLRLLSLDVSEGNPCASRARWVRLFQDHARTAYAAADRVTTVSAANVPLQAALGLRDAEVIPNGVEAPRSVGPLSTAEIARLHPSAGLPATARVGLIARVTPLKDVHRFLQAAAHVGSPGARFFVVGPQDDPGYAASCHRLAERLGLGGRVHFTGRQPADLWHRHLDVVALTSRSEAEPLALLEAMAHGTPVVTLDVGGCRALVAGGDAPAGGLVIPASDDAPRDLATAVDRIVGDPDLADALAAGGRSRGAARNISTLAARYRDIYRDLMGSARPYRAERREPSGSHRAG